MDASKNLTPTPHIGAKAGDFAATVLMPGDPLRAQYIAENFLENPVLVTSVRNVLGYTGTYKGKKVSVMASGMGIPSIGIYATELFRFYGVKRIIRVGTCGSFQPDLKVFETVLVGSASTNSAWANQYHLDGGTYSAAPDFETLLDAYRSAEKLGIAAKVVDCLSEDNFYSDDPDNFKKWADMGISCAEMETYALYCIAKRLRKQALTILSVSDSLVTHEATTSDQRVSAFTDMMKVALGCIVE